jgi:hypothetical protein
LRTRSRIRDSLLVAALAFGLAACGGNGGGGGANGDARLSEEEFLKRANAICQRYDEELDALGEPETAEALGEAINDAVPIIERGVAELRALRPPEESEQTFDQMVDAIASTIPVFRRLGDAVADQDQQTAQEALQEGQRIDRNSDRLATELGLDKCAGEDAGGTG